MLNRPETITAARSIGLLPLTRFPCDNRATIFVLCQEAMTPKLIGRQARSLPSIRQDIALSSCPTREQGPAASWS